MQIIFRIMCFGYISADSKRNHIFLAEIIKGLPIPPDNGGELNQPLNWVPEQFLAPGTVLHFVRRTPAELLMGGRGLPDTDSEDEMSGDLLPPDEAANERPLVQNLEIAVNDVPMDRNEHADNIPPGDPTQYDQIEEQGLLLEALQQPLLAQIIDSEIIDA